MHKPLNDVELAAHIQDVQALAKNFGGEEANKFIDRTVPKVAQNHAILLGKALGSRSVDPEMAATVRMAFELGYASAVTAEEQAKGYCLLHGPEDEDGMTAEMAAAHRARRRNAAAQRGRMLEQAEKILKDIPPIFIINEGE